MVLFAYQLDQVPIPKYRLSESSFDYLESLLEPHLRRIFAETSRIGDLVATGSARGLHLAVRGPDSFVHADLRALRVVETPGDPAALPNSRIYRFDQEES